VIACLFVQYFSSTCNINDRTTYCNGSLSNVLNVLSRLAVGVRVDGDELN